MTGSSIYGQNDHRPGVLVIAGYDQSAGAGVLADVKTLEAHGVYGYAVCTGITFQHERHISRVTWLSEKDVYEQIDVCFASRQFDWAKLGIAPSVSGIGAIIRHLRTFNPAIKIVLDPVIRASSGRDFWEAMDPAGLESVIGQIYLLTPNWDEMGWLYPGQDIMNRCRLLTENASCNIYLKGGHHPAFPGRDYLWSMGNVQVLEPPANPGPVYPKHGSGCVLSSSLAANLSLGYSLPMAAVRAKEYIGQFLTSNKNLLGWHRPLKDRSC